MRVYSGTIQTGRQVLNSGKGRKQRVGRMLLMHANTREGHPGGAGQATSWPSPASRDTTTGETLSDPAHPVVLERMEFPDPVIEVAVEAKTKADQDKLSVALARLAEEDPSFRVTADLESGQTIIRGMGELHLDILVDRMRREFKVGRQCRPAAGRLPRDHRPRGHDRLHPQEADRRRRPVRARQDRAGADEAGRGLRLREQGRGRRRAQGVHPGGRKRASRQGAAGRHRRRFPGHRLQGPARRWRVPRRRFQRARVRDRRARAAFRDALKDAGPLLLEPVMKVEAVTPEDYLGDVIGDLNARRGRVGGMEPRGNAQVVRAMVPLATMFGYVNTLRSLTQGRAQFTMEFDHYDQVPRVVSDEVRARYA